MLLALRAAGGVARSALGGGVQLLQRPIESKERTVLSHICKQFEVTLLLPCIGYIEVSTCTCTCTSPDYMDCRRVRL